MFSNWSPFWLLAVLKNADYSNKKDFQKISVCHDTKLLSSKKINSANIITLCYGLGFFFKLLVLDRFMNKSVWSLYLDWELAACLAIYFSEKLCWLQFRSSIGWKHVLSDFMIFVCTTFYYCIIDLQLKWSTRYLTVLWYRHYAEFIVHVLFFL